MPTLQIQTARDSAARLMEALTYYADPKNPDMSTQQFVQRFPMQQSDIIVVNRYLKLMNTGKITVRSRAVLDQWKTRILG